jgi:hypothetical protein
LQKMDASIVGWLASYVRLVYIGAKEGSHVWHQAG